MLGKRGGERRHESDRGLWKREAWSEFSFRTQNSHSHSEASGKEKHDRSQNEKMVFFSLACTFRKYTLGFSEKN